MTASCLALAICLIAQTTPASNVQSDAKTVETQKTDAKKFNISINPIELLIRGVNAGFDFAAFDKATIGTTARYINLDYKENRFRGPSLGLRSKVFILRSALENGPLITAKVELGRYEADVKDNGGSFFARGNTTESRLLGGYQWNLETGLNLDIGFGASHAWRDTFVYRASGLEKQADVPFPEGFGLTAELNIGYAW